MPKVLMLDQARFRKVPAFRRFRTRIRFHLSVQVASFWWEEDDEGGRKAYCCVVSILSAERGWRQVRCLFVRGMLFHVPRARDPSWIGASAAALLTSSLVLVLSRMQVEPCGCSGSVGDASGAWTLEMVFWWKTVLLAKRPKTACLGPWWPFFVQGCKCETFRANQVHSASNMSMSM